MNAIFKEQIHVRDDMSLRDIARLFQDGANHQFSEYLMGEQAMWSKGLAWVIVRRELFINRLPKSGDDIILITWAGRGRHGLYPRWFELREKTDGEDENGKLLVRANCQWAIIDSEEREMLFSDDVLDGAAPYCDKADEGPKIRISHRFSNQSSVKEVCPSKEMTDENHHVNNSYYLKWLEDLFEEVKLRSHVTDKESNGEEAEKASYLWIEYTKEILPESKVELRWAVDDTKINTGETEEIRRALFVKGYTGETCHFSAVIA